MTVKTIEYVQPDSRKWEGQNGTVFFVTVAFDDGSEGSIGANSEAKAEEHRTALRALKDTPTEFTLEANGEYQGRAKFKIKDYPGKPAGGGGGGGRSGGGGMSHAQAGYMAAASALGPVFATAEVQPDLEQMSADIIILGELLTQALFDRKPPPTQATATEEQHHEAGSSADAPTLAQMTTIKSLGAARGLSTTEEIAKALGVNKLGDLTREDMDTAIEAWS